MDEVAENAVKRDEVRQGRARLLGGETTKTGCIGWLADGVVSCKSILTDTVFGSETGVAQ